MVFSALAFEQIFYILLRLETLRFFLEEKTLSCLMKVDKIAAIEAKIGYHFKDSSLLTRALSHSSFANERHLPKHLCNERLEFLGDAVLELVSSEFLYEKNETKSEGELTKLRASAVCEPALAFCARELQLPNFLLLGNGEILTGGRERDSILADSLEALIGAIYLDGGLTNVKEFILKFVLNDLENKKLFYDSKTIFQEFVQSKNLGVISYRLVEEMGPDHHKTFKEAVYVGEQVYGIGEGQSKKAADQMAAYKGILKLKEENII